MQWWVSRIGPHQTCARIGSRSTSNGRYLGKKRSATRCAVALKCCVPTSPSREPVFSRLVMVDTAAQAASRAGRTATDMLCSDQEAGGSSLKEEQTSCFRAPALSMSSSHWPASCLADQYVVVPLHHQQSWKRRQAHGSRNARRLRALWQRPQPGGRSLHLLV